MLISLVLKKKLVVDVLIVLFLLSYSGGPDQAVLSWLFFPNCPLMTFPTCLFCLASPVLAVLSLALL
jgi:hypothetical protein